MTPDKPQVRCFRYQTGTVASEPVTHYLAAIDGNTLLAWCGERLAAERVEDCTEPGNPPEPGRAPPGAPCPICLLRLMAAIDSTQAVTLTPQQLSRLVPAGGVITADQVAPLLLKAHWALGEAMHDVPAGRYSTETLSALADMLTRLAQVVRAHAARRNGVHQ